MDIQDGRAGSRGARDKQAFGQVRPIHEGVSDGSADIDLAGASQLQEYVKRTVDLAPPLTHEQRDHLALLLRPNEGSQTRAAG
jgi:hypothetical protein